MSVSPTDWVRPWRCRACGEPVTRMPLCDGCRRAGTQTPDAMALLLTRQRTVDYDDLHRLARDLAEHVHRSEGCDDCGQGATVLIARCYSAGLLVEDAYEDRPRDAVSDPTAPTTATPPDDAEGRTDAQDEHNG